MVDSGVRAEMLFATLGRFNDTEEVTAVEAVDGATQEPGTNPNDASPVPVFDGVSVDNFAYLKSPLRFRPRILLDSPDNAVMMDWEATIMNRHAETLIPTPELRTMNIGHGMGIVDHAMLSRNPSEHHIIEAHPPVLARLKEQGW